MAGVEGIEQGARLDSAHFAENDPVRSPAKGGFPKIIERDAGLERVGLAFGRTMFGSGCEARRVSSMTTMRS